MKFKDLQINDSFDWINDAKVGYNSFFERCYKISKRTYTTESGIKYQVGSINAEVYHVERPSHVGIQHSG